jgi:hypothetical protein
VASNEPETELALPAPEPSCEQAGAEEAPPAPLVKAGAALLDSPPPEPQQAEPEAGGGEQVEAPDTVPAEIAGKCPAPAYCRLHQHNTCLLAGASQPPIVEAAGTCGEPGVLSTLGGEVDDIRKIMLLPGDKVSRMRQVFKALDEIALVRLDCSTDVCVVEPSFSSFHVCAGYEQECRGQIRKAGRIRKAHRLADAGADQLRADHCRAPGPTQGPEENASRYAESHIRVLVLSRWPRVLKPAHQCRT